MPFQVVALEADPTWQNSLCEGFLNTLSILNIVSPDLEKNGWRSSQARLAHAS